MGTLEASNVNQEPMDASSTPEPMDTSALPAETTAPRELTGEEQALYDRQIRLWGLEAQQRLASSNILLLGDVTSLVAQELAKNCVLAGVARLTFMEDASNEGKEASHAFLGSSLQGMIQSLKEMNPHVEVETRAENFNAVSSFSVVCAIGISKEKELALDERCRSANVPFFAGRVAGKVGWFFLDLTQRYIFTDKSKEKVRHFCSYTDAHSAPWPTERRNSLFGWQFTSALLEFEAQHGRLPSNSNELKEKDSASLLEIFESFREKKAYKPRAKEDCENVKQSLIKIGESSQFMLAPVAAIVGGMWGREVTKVVSRKGEPLRNFYYFNCETSTGTIERIGPRE